MVVVFLCLGTLNLKILVLKYDPWLPAEKKYKNLCVDIQPRSRFNVKFYKRTNSFEKKIAT